MHAEREQNIAMISPEHLLHRARLHLRPTPDKGICQCGSLPSLPPTCRHCRTTETRQFALFEDSGYPFEGTLAVKLDGATLITRKVNIPPCDVVLFPGTPHPTQGTNPLMRL